MGETHETEALTDEMCTEKTKTRRNGMWNIFEGVDNTVLEKLGLSEEVVHQIVTEADDTVSEHLATHQADAASDTGGCQCRRARILRSFSATVGEEMRAALQNRHRRNAVGNLFDVLTPSQKLLLVEHLQEQLERLQCLCGAEDVGNATSNADSNSGIILAWTELSSSSSTSSQSGGSGVSSSCSKEVVCS